MHDKAILMVVFAGRHLSACAHFYKLFDIFRRDISQFMQNMFIPWRLHQIDASISENAANIYLIVHGGWTGIHIDIKKYFITSFYLIALSLRLPLALHHTFIWPDESIWRQHGHLWPTRKCDSLHGMLIYLETECGQKAWSSSSQATVLQMKLNMSNFGARHPKSKIEMLDYLISRPYWLLGLS